MAKLHISQDDTGFWQMTFEDDQGRLTLISHQFPSSDHLIEDARELVESGRVPETTIVIGPPRSTDATKVAGMRRQPYVKPSPKKAVD